MNVATFLGITVATIGVTTIGAETHIDPLSRLVDFGTTGLVVYFGGKEIVKAINGVGQRIDKQTERIQDLRATIVEVRVMLSGSMRNTAISTQGDDPQEF